MAEFSVGARRVLELTNDEIPSGYSLACKPRLITVDNSRELGEDPKYAAGYWAVLLMPDAQAMMLGKGRRLDEKNLHVTFPAAGYKREQNPEKVYMHGALTIVKGHAMYEPLVPHEREPTRKSFLKELREHAILGVGETYPGATIVLGKPSRIIFQKDNDGDHQFTADCFYPALALFSD